MSKKHQTQLPFDTPSPTEQPLTEVVESVIEPLFKFTNSLQQTLTLMRHLLVNQESTSAMVPTQLPPLEKKLIDLINRIENLEQKNATSSMPEKISQVINADNAFSSADISSLTELILLAINKLPESKLREHFKQAIERIHNTTVNEILMQRNKKSFTSLKELLDIKYMSENRLEQLSKYFEQSHIQAEVKSFLSGVSASNVISSSSTPQETSEVATEIEMSPSLEKLILDAINHLTESNLREYLKNSIPRIHDTTINTIVAQRRKKDFSSIKELLDVKYMSENRLEQLSQYLTQSPVQAEIEQLSASKSALSSSNHEEKPAVANIPQLTQFVLDAINQLPEPNLREHLKQAIERVHDTTINAIIVQRRKKFFTSKEEVLQIKYMSENRLAQLTEYLAQAQVQAEVKTVLSTSKKSIAANPTPSTDMSPSAQFLLDVINQLPEKNLREHFKLAIPRVHDTTVNAALAQRRKKFFSSQEELIKIKYMSQTRRQELEDYFAQPKVKTQIKPLIASVTTSTTTASTTTASTTTASTTTASTAANSTRAVASLHQVNEPAPSPMTLHPGTKTGSSAALPPLTKLVLDLVNQLSTTELRNLFKQAIPRIHDTTVSVIIAQRQKKAFTSLDEVLAVNYMSENRLQQLKDYLNKPAVKAEMKLLLSSSQPLANNKSAKEVKKSNKTSTTRSITNSKANLLKALTQLSEQELRNHFKQAIPRLHNSTLDAIIARCQKKKPLSEEELVNLKGMGESRLGQLVEYFQREEVI